MKTFNSQLLKLYLDICRQSLIYGVALVILSSVPNVAMDQPLSFSGRTIEKPREVFLGFQISKPLLKIALQPRTLTFERLEFLGDRVLGLTVAQFLYGKYPSADVPELAKIFESIVSNDSLAGIYEILNIKPSWLASTSYCAPTNGPISQKTCSDIVEAFMGAVYRQGGFQESCAFGEKLLKEYYDFKEDTPAKRLGYSTLSCSHRPSSQKVESLQDKISYKFQNIHLLQEAFWHSSMGGSLYKKLDFLGVRILALAVAEELYNANPDDGEGSLTQKFASIISNDSLTTIFEAWQFGPYLVRQSGDFSSSVSPRIAANTLRALVGAVYLDHKDWLSARSVCRLLLSFKTSETQVKKPALRLEPPHPTSFLEKSSIVLKKRKTSYFDDVPLEVVQKIFGFIQNPVAASLQKTNFRKCTQLSLVSKEWGKLFIDVYQPDIPYYHAWSIQGITLDAIKQHLYRVPEEEGAYLDKWFWEDSWSLFEAYYTLPNNQDGLPKLPVRHLSGLTVREDFNQESPSSFAFLRCLLPQLKLDRLWFKGLKDNDWRFLQILFEDPQSSSNIQDIYLEGINLSSAGYSLLAFIPLLHSRRLILLNPQGQLTEASLEKALLSSHNLGEFQVRDTRITKNIQFAETLLAISARNATIPNIAFNGTLAMIMGRQHFQDDDPKLAQEGFRIAMTAGFPEATLWLAELLINKFTPSRLEEARLIYQSVAQHMEDEQSATLASARLVDLFGNEEDDIKDIISKSHGRWSVLDQDDSRYNQALLDYCWVIENFSQKKGKWNFSIIDWLQNRKYIEGTPPRRMVGHLALRGGREKEEENNNKSLSYLNSRIKELYKALTMRGFTKGIIGLHKFYIRIGNFKKAEKCLKRSAKKNDPSIMFALGRFYETYVTNITEANHWYQQAANRKNGYAKVWLANNTLSRTGDISTCLRLYRQVALSGHSYAAYTLYEAYQNGFLIERKYPLPSQELQDAQQKASSWFKFSHFFGNPWVMKSHLTTFKDSQDFGSGILYLQTYPNPFMKKSEYLNHMGYFYMKKYEFSRNEKHFDKAKTNFEAAMGAAPTGMSFYSYEKTVQGVTASLNLGWLHYTRALYEPSTRADDLQRANSHTSHAWYYSGKLSGVTEGESKAFQEQVNHNWTKIKKSARRFSIKLQPIGYD